MSDRLPSLTEFRDRQQAIQARCVHPSGTFVPFGPEALEQSIPARFEQQVRWHADRTAVKTRTQELTYGALNTAANRLAHAILARCGAGLEPVPLLLYHETPLIVGTFGVLKAGKIRVILHPSLPEERLAWMLSDLQARTLVCDNAHLALAQRLAPPGCAVFNLDALDAGASPENPGLTISPDASAQIFYTSGSTGRSKGVVESHRGLIQSVMRQINVTHICPEDRISMFSTGQRAVYRALLSGAAIYPVDIQQDGVTLLADLMVREGITTYFTAPSIFRQFVGTLTGEERFPHLRLIILGGEPATTRDVALYRRYFSDDCILINGLTSTEAGDYCYYYLDKETEIRGGTLPVGWALEGVEALLMGDAGRPVADGEAGEIVLKSRYLATGYWARPDLTRAAFQPAPEGDGLFLFRTGDLGRREADGCLHCLGRKDLQVKIRGFRVDIPEVEFALLALDTVADAVVIDREEESGETKLVAYLVPKGTRIPTVGELRRALAATLPDYMVPTAFVILDAFPRAVTGKVDRRALPAPGTVRPELDTGFVAPRTPVEETLAGIWTEVLKLDAVGVDDPFLELGGDSLLATRIATRVLETFGVRVPIRTLLEEPTVARMAARVGRIQAAREKLAEIERRLAELQVAAE